MADNLVILTFRQEPGRFWFNIPFFKDWASSQVSKLIPIFLKIVGTVSNQVLVQFFGLGELF